MHYALAARTTAQNALRRREERGRTCPIMAPLLLMSYLREPASTGGVVLASSPHPISSMRAGPRSALRRQGRLLLIRGCYVDVKGNHKVDVEQLRMCKSCVGAFFVGEGAAGGGPANARASGS